MLRELACMQLDAEPPTDETEQLMDDEQFEEEARMAAEGRWEELGLDELPDGWSESSIDELRNASN